VGSRVRRVPARARNRTCGSRARSPASVSRYAAILRYCSATRVEQRAACAGALEQRVDAEHGEVPLSLRRCTVDAAQQAQHRGTRTIPVAEPIMRANCARSRGAPAGRAGGSHTAARDRALPWRRHPDLAEGLPSATVACMNRSSPRLLHLIRQRRNSGSSWKARGAT
jgi:hypothetical protein